ncbi:MAG: hypothetical protein ACRBF0_04445 [Calditrichia bacterium]
MSFLGLLTMVALIGCALFLLLTSNNSVFDGAAGGPERTSGNLTNLEEYIARLIAASSNAEEISDDTFLIGIVKETDDFLQFTSDKGSVMMDFPLLTDRQKSYEDKLKSICAKLGVLPAQYIHESTTEFGTAADEDRLAYHLTGAPEKISAMIAVIYTNLFEIEPDTEMHFVANGF